MWIGFSWFRIELSDMLLWTWYWNLGFCKMHWISWPAELLSSFQGGLCFMALVIWNIIMAHLVLVIFITQFNCCKMTQVTVPYVCVLTLCWFSHFYRTDHCSSSTIWSMVLWYWLDYVQSQTAIIWFPLLSKMWQGVFLEEKPAKTFKFGMWETATSALPVLSIHHKS